MKKEFCSQYLNGYLTVFLSLSVTVILSLLLVLLEGARINTIRMEAECVAAVSMNSVLAEFNRELLAQFDLFFVDMSYGGSSHSIHNSEEHLRDYMQNNFIGDVRKGSGAGDWLSLSADRAEITEYSIASDQDGSVMKRQAVSYMKTSTPEGALAGLAGNVSLAEGVGLDSRNIDGERNGVQAEIDSIALPEEEDENGEIRKMQLDNPADRVNSLRGANILNLVMGDNPVSNAAIHTENYLSKRSKIIGNGICPPLEEASSAADQFLYNQYLFEKLGIYGKEKEKSLLKYQIEYVVFGFESDRENLDRTAGRLLKWREVSNIAYLLTDTAKCAQAKALALSLTAVMQVPVLVEPVKYSILFAWAYIESLSDVKGLLKGGKVPILKTSADWKTGIENIADFHGDIPGEEDVGRGQDYKDYLAIMLFLQREDDKNRRAMDIMEMDIRQTPGNSHFRMDACFDSFQADIEVTSGFGYAFKTIKKCGYY